jgi:hypothetical protein
VTDETRAASARDDARGEIGERHVVLAADFGDNHGAMIPNGSEP